MKQKFTPVTSDSMNVDNNWFPNSKAFWKDSRHFLPNIFFFLEAELDDEQLSPPLFWDFSFGHFNLQCLLLYVLDSDKRSCVCSYVSVFSVLDLQAIHSIVTLPSLINSSH